MTNFSNVSIKSFLKEREDRFKPEEANEKGLKRLEKIDFSGNIHLVDDKETRTGMILVKKGDLVISGINVEKGAIAVYNGETDVLATIHYSSYSFDKSKIDVEYFKWFLRSKTFKDIVNLSIKGGIKTELKPKKFLPLIIPLPDLDIQIKIRKKLDSVEDEINELGNLNFKNEDYIQKLRQSILQEAVSGKIVSQDPKDEPASELLKKIKAEKERLIREKKAKRDKDVPITSEISFQIPNNWAFVRLTSLVSILGDGIHGTPNYSDEGEYYFVNGNNLNEGKIDIKPNTKRVSQEEYYKYKKELNDKTIFVSINGTIGNVAFYNNEKLILGKSVCYFNLLDGILKEYLKILIKTNYFLGYALDSATGTTIKNVSLESMRMFLVPLPPLPEQLRIVQKVDQLIKLCDELEEKVKENQKNSELLMESVLKEAFEV